MTRPGDLAPQKMEFTDADGAGECIVSDDWVAEQKVDGVRLMCRVGSGRVDFVGIGGVHVKHAASALHFDRLRAELLAYHGALGKDFVLDGELLPHNGEYWAYDLPLLGEDHVRPSDTLDERRYWLEAVVTQLGGSFKLLPQALTEAEKHDLCQRVFESEAEGIVFKRLDAPYESNVRAKHQLKWKFVKEADCVVLELGRDGANNAVLGLWDGDQMREVGKTSMIGKDPTITIGSVVEVHFLYATEALTLYQPRIVRHRHDKESSDCLLQQLRPVSKEVLRG